jgi:hypothetical protein
LTHKVPPKPSILDEFEVVMVSGGRRIWKSPDGKRYYTWDTLHGEVEVFNSRGAHLGSIDPITGKTIKYAEKGRRIDV